MSQDTVKTIVIKYLADGCFDGLYNENVGCACKVDDLMPCSDVGDGCCPGVLIDMPTDGEHDFFIGERK